MCNIPGFQNQFMALQTPLDPLHPTSSSFTFLRIFSDFAVGGSEEKFSFLASLLVFLSFNYDMIFMDNLGWEWLKVFALFLASGVLGSDGGQEGEMVSGSWRGRSCENLSRPTMLYQYEDQQDEVVIKMRMLIIVVMVASDGSCDVNSTTLTSPQKMLPKYLL